MPILALGAALSGALPVVSGVGAARAARATAGAVPAAAARRRGDAARTRA